MTSISVVVSDRVKTALDAKAQAYGHTTARVARDYVLEGLERDGFLDQFDERTQEQIEKTLREMDKYQSDD